MALSKSALRKLPCSGVFKKRSHDTHMERDLPWLMDGTKPVEVVFLGDSHFERMLWYSNGVLASKIPKNCMIASVGGDRVENVLYRLETHQGILFQLFRRQQTKKIVFMAGGNNLHSKQEDQKQRQQREAVDPVAVVKKILHTIRLYLPDVQIEVWAIPQDKAKSPEIVRYNHELENMCLNQKVQFKWDVYNASTKADKIWLDDVHLTLEGYKQCVLPFVESSARV